MREAGVGRSTLVLAVVLAFVGFFVIPVIGGPIGFVLGIYLVELGHSRDAQTAWASTKAALRAVFLIMGIELLAAVAIATTWVVPACCSAAERRARVAISYGRVTMVVATAVPALLEAVHERLLPPAGLGSRLRPLGRPVGRRTLPSGCTAPEGGLARRGGVRAKATAATITAKPAAPTHIVVLTPTSTSASPARTPTTPMAIRRRAAARAPAPCICEANWGPRHTAPAPSAQAAAVRALRAAR